jgi:hypothetical protein
MESMKHTVITITTQPSTSSVAVIDLKFVSEGSKFRVEVVNDVQNPSRAETEGQAVVRRRRQLVREITPSADNFP